KQPGERTGTPPKDAWGLPCRPPNRGGPHPRGPRHTGAWPRTGPPANPPGRRVICAVQKYRTWPSHPDVLNQSNTWPLRTVLNGSQTDRQSRAAQAHARRGRGGAGKAGRRAPGGGDALGCSRAPAVLVLVWLPARYPDGRPPDPALTRNDLKEAPGRRPGASFVGAIVRRATGGPDGRGDGPRGHPGRCERDR